MKVNILVGDLTLHGTKSVKLAAYGGLKDPWGNTKMALTEGKINRKDWD
jgi:polyisoprenoid-binding protein YceI